MDGQLTVWGFRFLTMITGKEAVQVQGSMSLEQQVLVCDIAIFLATYGRGDGVVGLPTRVTSLGA